jgi:hypothetical protein
MQSQHAGEEIDRLVPQILEKYKDQIEDEGLGMHFGLIVPFPILALLKWSDSTEDEERA